MEELEERAKENLMKLLDCLGPVTLPLVAYNKGDEWPCGYASGFIVQRHSRTFLLTAAHAICKRRWFVEVRVGTEDGDPAILIPLKQTWTIDKSFDLTSMSTKRIDFGWAELDLKALRRQASSDEKIRKGIELPSYRGPLDRTPSSEDVYTYIAFNRIESEDHGGMKILERSASMACGMTYVGRGHRNKDVYRFKLDDQHRGHDYYKGSSGAPIADAEGCIVSTVLGGDRTTDEIFGLPLADYEHLVGAIE